MSVYLNNAATTWPKPPCVAGAVADFITRGGANLARGTASERDLTTLSVVMDCRVFLAGLLGGFENGNPRYVTFCSGVTEALNVVLKGFLCSGPPSDGALASGGVSTSGRALASGRVLTSNMEHNAVIRPLRGLERRGLRLEFLDCDPDGLLRPETVAGALDDEKADLVVLGHASNVCGTIQPLEEIAAVCRKRGVPLVVDAAQTAGILPIRVAEWGLSALCFTGHKGLMGPQGVGGIVWNPDFAGRVEPLVEGGTGSFSHVEVQPSDMPDKFEAGTPNLPGIAGLYAALSWLAETGIENIERRERELGQRLLDGLERFGASSAPRGSTLQGGRTTMEGRLPVFSLNFRSSNDGILDNGLLADRLSREGFETRPGLHCAPLAHRRLGSFPQGSLRVSPGYFNTFEDVDSFMEALEKCTREN